MRQITIRFLCCLILGLAGYTSYIFLNPASVFGADTESPVDTAPKVDHILLRFQIWTLRLPSTATFWAFTSGPGARTL
jgi:hypothetical protein